MVKNKIKENIMRAVFFLAACISIIAVLLICWFIFSNAFPAIGKIGVTEFLFGTEWRPLNDKFGIFPMIIGSLYVTAGGISLGGSGGVMWGGVFGRCCPPRRL